MSRAYDAANYHVTSRLGLWLRRKHKVFGGQDTHDVLTVTCTRSWGYTSSDGHAGVSRPRPCERVEWTLGSTFIQELDPLIGHV